MRKIVSLILALLLACSLAVTASALERDGYVTDLYGLLETGQEQALENEAERISETYDRGVYVFILDDYARYGAGNLYTTAGDIYLATGMGRGAWDDGLLLLLSMDQRMAVLISHDGSGQFVTADGKDWLASKYLVHFEEDNWYEGLLAYLKNSETLLQMAAGGTPMTWLTRPGVQTLGFALSLLLGLLIAWIFVKIKENQLRSVFTATTARDYVAQGGVTVTRKSDVFLHRQTTRRRIEKKDSGGGSRGTDSRGFSGRTDRF